MTFALTDLRHLVTSRQAPGSASLASLAVVAVLAACGGAQDGASTAAEARQRPMAVTVNPGGWVTVTQPTDVLMQNLAIPATAPTRGMWSGVGTWPMNGLHQAVLPDGKVLTWGTTPDGTGQNGRYFDVWDPNRGLFDAGAHNFTYDATRQDSFCAPSVYLGDGRLMITGGNGDLTSQVYTPSSNSYARGANVADARWYATMITLPDGRPIVLGGINPYTEGQWTNPDQSVTQGLSSMTPEVYENGAWRSLFGAQSRTAFGPDFLRASLPKAWVAPDGRVFGIGSDQMFYVDPNGGGGNGALVALGQYKAPPSATATVDTALNVGPTMSAVMYAPGKVLTAGGNAFHNGSGYAASRRATSIDLNGGGAVLTELPSMANPRNFANLIILPDGKVLATGGETRANNDPALGVYAAEQWNPSTNTWTTLASAAVFRGYHSQTSLLTNGTVLSAGGGTPGPIQLKGEVFYPPYLFRTVNNVAQLAPRPQMVGISGLSYANGATMQVDMANNAPVSQLVLVGLSVGTHSFNSGQRRIPLAFTQEDIRLTATLPGNTLAPPGYYQVIALNANGVPSRGTVIAVGQGVSTPPGGVTPYNPPVIGGTIGAPAIAAGGTATYTVPATTGVTYSWTFGDGTAATPFSTTASISHVYAAAGVYGVTLTARAADGSTSTRSFLQAVTTPATAGRPVASSATALETRSGASTRLWVANPDTDTVAVIDTANNTRTAEIAVGASPRSLAIAPDGRVWVTSKGSSSISIVNPATLVVAATVALPRAAQPHGLVFAPGGSAFVALEATGQLLKLDPASGAAQATLAVGSAPAPPVGHGQWRHRAGVALRDQPAARRRHGGGEYQQRRRRGAGGQCRADDAGPHDRAAAQRQGRQRGAGRRHPQLPGGRRGVARRPQRLGAVEAGQHQARHAAQRAAAELPEQRACDQLAHRHGHAGRGHRAPHRPRQLEPGRRSCVPSERGLPVHRARDEPPGGGGRRRGRPRVGQGGTSVVRRRRCRSPPTGRACTCRTSWTAASACSTSARSRHKAC